MISAQIARQSTAHASEVHHCEVCGEPIITAPLLKCKECGETIRLRCFVYPGRENRYLAECIDLDITAEGDSVKEAIAGLQDALHGYLSVVFEGQDTRGLIFRRSPLTHRVRYYFERFKDTLCAIFSKPRRRTADRFYIVPSHSQCC